MIIQREHKLKLFLLLSDSLAIGVAYSLALLLRFYLARELIESVGGKKGAAPLMMYLKTFPYILFIYLITFRFSGCYSLAISGVEEFFTIVKAVIFSLLISLGVAFFYRDFEYSRMILIIFVVLTPVLVILFRTIGRWLREKLLIHSRSLIRLVIVGTNELGKTLAAELSRLGDLGYELVGFVDDNSTEKCLGKIEALEEIIRKYEINEVWIALPSSTPAEKKKLVEICLKCKVSWKLVPELYDIMLDWIKIDSLAGIPLIGMRRSNITGLNIWIKRLLDLVIVIPLIIVTTPIMLVIAILIKITSPGPVLFKQKRIGKDGRRFVFFKFRTMYPRQLIQANNRTVHKDFTKEWIEGRQMSVYKLKDDPRVTPLGRWLRRFSLDELPQFFNVLKGDMSLVGPRPAVPYEVAQYQEWHKRRLETKPGITGLWQVSGRNQLSFEEMVKLDIYYIENWSIGLDLKIMVKTLWAVLFSRAY